MGLFRAGKPDYGDGGQMSDFVYIMDCVELMFWLIENPRVSGIFNVGTGKAHTWNDLIKAVFVAMNREPLII